MTVASPGVEARGPLYTAEDLWALPPQERFELIDGRLTAMSPMGDGHGARTMRLSAYLTIHILDQGLGEVFSAETGFLLARDPDVALAPDFAFVTNAKLTFARGFGFAAVVPDLVLETRSPSDRRPDITAKVKRWLYHGVAVVLDADPQERTITVHRRNALPVTLGVDDTLTLPDLLPGFSLRLARVF